MAIGKLYQNKFMHRYGYYECIFSYCSGFRSEGGKNSMKRIIVSAADKVVALVLVTLLCFACAYANAPEVETFDFSEYEDTVVRFKRDKTVKPITNRGNAVKKAKTLLKEVYGDIFGDDMDESGEHWGEWYTGTVCKTYYDPKRDVWMVEAVPQFDTPPNWGVLHGSHYCFIEGETGKVLGIYGTR